MIDTEGFEQTSS